MINLIGCICQFNGRQHIFYIIVRKMFDMLDDDLEIGYVPTMPNSRSGNMKKLTKKQPKQAPSKPINNKSNDFDDLLDDLIELDHKKPNKSLDNKSAAPKNLFNSLEAEFDQPKSTSLDKKGKQPISNNLSRSPVLKLDQSDEIIHEDRNFNSFGKSQQTIVNNSSKAEEVFVSSRNMKPPMRKKSQVQVQNLNFGTNSIGLTIPEESNSKTISKNEDDDIIRPPPRLMNRRSSVDAKNEQTPLSLPKNNKVESNPVNNFSFEYKRQEEAKPRGLTLSLDQPKISPQIKKKEQVISFKPQVKPVQQVKQQKIIPKQQNNRRVQSMHVDQSITILRDSPNQINKSTAQQYQKQMQSMKLLFQKQIDFLQQNLDRQITLNRETRDKLMRESNKMIEEERIRSKRINEQQIKRIKQMFEWQKRRSEETYQTEIQNLKQSLEYAQKNNSYSFKTTNTSRQDSQYLQSQLKHQKKLIQDRQRILDKREFDLSQRQAQFNKRKRKEEQRLREQQKRILQAQMKIKKQLLEQKRMLSEEKQQMAIELANLQIEAMKKRQKAQYSLKENKIQKEGLQNERYQLRNQNAELMARYRQKVEEVEHEKIKIRAIETDLIRKLKIVQQRMRQTNQNSINKTTHTKKQNNWIEDRDRSHQNLKTYSIEKAQAVNKSINNTKTKDRFYQLEGSVKDRLNISVKQNKKFDLDNYMMNVEEYKRLRGQA